MNFEEFLNEIELQEEVKINVLNLIEIKYSVFIDYAVSLTDKNLCEKTFELLCDEFNDELNHCLLAIYLLAAFHSHSKYKSMGINDKIFIDTTLPNIADRWKEVKIPLPNNRQTLNQITTMMNKIVKNQWKAQEDIEKCKKNFDVYSV